MVYEEFFESEKNFLLTKTFRIKKNRNSEEIVEKTVDLNDENII